MISADDRASIQRLYHAEAWSVGNIARHFHLHHSTVRRVLGLLPTPLRRAHPSILDPFLPWLLETLQKYPSISARRLWDMARLRGYPGLYDHFRFQVARHRKKPVAEAYLRLRTLPAEQAQVDWGHFGTLNVGRATRRLSGFVMTLSYSRRPFVYFFLDQKLPNFLAGHQAAFEFFGGVPRVILYDNLKSVVLQRIGDAIQFHPQILDFCAHYKYEPRPVAVYRGNEKGRVERLIQYVRSSFFEAREYRDLDDLNAQAKAWCEGLASDRPWPEDRTRTVRQVFEEERASLLPLPPNPFPVAERLEVRVGKTPYARFDLNDYSVPHTCVCSTLTVLATPEQVRIFRDTQQIAVHARSYDKGCQIEDPSHLQKLVESKRAARQHRSQNRLHHEVALASTLLEQLAQQGYNLGSTTLHLMRLLDQHGAAALSRAISLALQAGTIHPHSVAGILERTSREKQDAPSLPLVLADPRLAMRVQTHPLDAYNQLLSLHKDSDR